MSGTNSTVAVVLLEVVVVGRTGSWLSTAGVAEEDASVGTASIGTADTSLIGTGSVLLVVAAAVVAVALDDVEVFVLATAGCFASSSSMLLFSLLHALRSVRANYSITHHIYIMTHTLILLILTLVNTAQCLHLHRYKSNSFCYTLYSSQTSGPYPCQRQLH